jgi:hypothetical protein
MAGALPPADAPHAFVIEYRPLDRCAPPACSIRTRDVHGYAKDVMEDGDPGRYVTQGVNYQHELFFQRGVFLRPGESFDFDLPQAAYASELDFIVSAALGKDDYDAEIIVKAVPGVGAPARVNDEQHVRGHTAAFSTPKPEESGHFERFGRHVRIPLPSRAQRLLRVSIVNRGTSKLALGSPLVMKRVEGRGPRQGVFVIHDALLFHEAAALLFGGTKDPKADWIRAAVADRGVYFPEGQSIGHGTANFVLRFFTGSYYAGAWGWPGMYGHGFDETLPAAVPGPVARAAEQGFVTAFFGDNFTALPNFGNIGWDVGFNSERRDHPAVLQRLVEQWAAERPDDDALVFWWNANTHAPYGPGRAGPPAPAPDLPADEINHAQVDGCWRNLLEGADRFKSAYDALRKASPRASRIVWIGADHSSASSAKMGRRSYRLPAYIGTGLLHASAGAIEEVSTPFAILYDDPARRHAPAIVKERTNSFLAWRAFESFLGIDLHLPQSSTFQSAEYPDPHAGPVWDDRVMVSVASTATLRARLGNISYSLYTPKLTQTPAWKITDKQQLLLLGAPAAFGGVQGEELYDDVADPYEYDNLAPKRLEDTIRMRREMTDWLAAQWEHHRHPRHRNRLVFPQAVDLDVFAPRSFTAVVDDAQVRSTDPRLAHVHGKELVVVEGVDPVGIVELRGATRPYVLKCSANGLPLDVLTPERPRFNLEVARTNCPLPAGPHDVAGPDDVLFSYEPAQAHPVGPQNGAPLIGPGTGAVENDELLAGMKRWGYVRDMDDKKKP